MGGEPMQTSGPERRVIWLLDSLRAGGAERLALRFAALAPPPWRVDVWALQPPPGGLTLAQIWGAEGEALAASRRIRQFAMRSLHDAGAWVALVGALRRERPALLHAHLRYATVWGGTAAPWLRLPWVATVHVLPQAEAGGRGRALAALEARVRRRARRVIYLGGAQQAAWARAAQRERAVLRANGVAIPPPLAAGERLALRRARGWRDEERIFLTVAVVRARKGWRHWLEAVERAAPRCPQARFVWVGGGPEYAALAAAAGASRAAEQIRLAGPSAEVGAWLACADVFVFPSEEEAQPTAVLEAMAAGLPVIASALPAMTEVLGDCGRLVPAGDARALAQAMEAWAVETAETTESCRRAGRARARAGYSESAWVQGVLGLYEEVLGGGSEAAGARTAAGLGG
jgi:glycosyltransferase involved in cell wall biosynthesis